MLFLGQDGGGTGREGTRAHRTGGWRCACSDGRQPEDAQRLGRTTQQPSAAAGEMLARTLDRGWWGHRSVGQMEAPVTVKSRKLSQGRPVLRARPRAGCGSPQDEAMGRIRDNQRKGDKRWLGQLVKTGPAADVTVSQG